MLDPYSAAADRKLQKRLKAQQKQAARRGERGDRDAAASGG